MASLSAVMLVSYLAPHVLHCTLPVSVSKLLRSGGERARATAQTRQRNRRQRCSAARPRIGAPPRCSGHARRAGAHSLALTLFSWLQKGQVNSLSSLGATFLGGGLLDLRLPCVARGATQRRNPAPRRGGGDAGALAAGRTHHLRGTRVRRAERAKRAPAGGGAGATARGRGAARWRGRRARARAQVPRAKPCSAARNAGGAPAGCARCSRAVAALQERASQ